MTITLVMHITIYFQFYSGLVYQLTIIKYTHSLNNKYGEYTPVMVVMCRRLINEFLLQFMSANVS